ncbi:hypothetical protein LINPERPRIM_LOCUS21020 [Linum perenne]
MEDYRSKSYADGRSSQLDLYNGQGGGGGGGMQDLRCYSTSNSNQLEIYNPSAVKFNKGKSTNGSVSKSWSFNDPELQRKKRVASYKVYTVEGKVKGSFRKSFRWLKDRYSRVANGWW